MKLNVWQDEVVNEDGLIAVADDIDPETVRSVGDVETLKALADPVRLAILSAMMRGTASALRVMSVKELAAELGEPQTKLYRHVKQLEAVGLIKSVSSRVVSGIVEQRYQACQADLILGPGLTDSQKSSAEAEATVAAALEMYRRQFFAEHRAAKARAETDAGLGEPEMVLGMRVARVTRARAADILARLEQIQDDVSDSEDEAADGEVPADDTVKINVLVGYFSPEESAAGATS